MAINSFEKQCDKIHNKYSSNSPRGSALPSCQLVRLSIATDDSTTSSDSKSIKSKKKGNLKSPYLNGDSVHLLSRVTEKKLYSQHKKASDIVSSFPLAANIYKANSDEFKSQKKGIKKVKKSVLTLPNAPTAVPQTCTVSDMNDSEYCNGSDDNRKLKAKKRLVAQNKKAKVRNKDYEFYDRDARYCSQMNINLDCSSTDVINQFTGDGKSVSGKFRRGKGPQAEQEFNAHDVWAVLRNINRFQFRPSPPISEDSIHSPKKKKIRNKRRNNRKDTRVIETCRTEEFAYISSFEVDSKSPRSFSQSSSFDRITVIDKQDEFSEICKEFEKSVIKTKNVKVKNRLPNTNKNQNRKNPKNNVKAIGHKEQNESQGPHNKIINDCNKTLEPKEYECQFKDNNYYDNPETLVRMHLDSKPSSPRKQRLNNSANRDRSDGINFIVNRANEFDYTLCSESSKVGITTARKDNDEKLPKVASDESGQQVKGITKVILSKGQSLMNNKRNEFLKRKPRLATTMPSTTILPKLTQTEIKRRLANMKFPIVVLGKDQLGSASIQIMNDPLHLEAVNQPIWPFMQDWYEPTNLKKHSPEKVKSDDKFEESTSPRNKHQAIDRKNNLRKSNEMTVNKQSAVKDKNCLNVEAASNKKKYPKRPLPPNEITKVKPQQTKKPKPIHQLKDKMLKLLYKNTSAKDIDEKHKISGHGDSNLSDDVHAIEAKISDASKKVDVSTETLIKYFVPQDLSRSLNVNARPDPKKMPISRQPWAKAKWASEYIETVIKKIRSGVYYNQENKCQQKIPKTADLKEASIQTILSGKNFSVNEEVIKEDKIVDNEVTPYGENKYLETLPGFDDSLPALEIKTMNMKEVAVKYCTTNVMVQFDVAVPSDPENIHPIQTSSSFVPLAITESHTKIFKCKTTIVNAMLPAEICSLLPKIIRSIIDSNKPPPLPPAKFPNESLLYTISELSHCESPDIFKATLPPPMFPKMSPILSNLLDGSFANKKTAARLNLDVPKVGYDRIIKDMLEEVSVQRLVTLNGDLLPLRIPKPDLGYPKAYDGNAILKTNTCTALDLYRERNPMIKAILYNNSSNLDNLWKPNNNNYQFRISIFHISLDVTLDNNKITVTLSNRDYYEAAKRDGTSTVIGNIKIDSLYNGFMKRDNDAIPLKAIEYKHNTENDNSIKKAQKQTLQGKTKKKSYVKLYKKCKSTSNISGERFSTSLSKIINLDDFFQALGSGKILSSVFDGFSGKKILSSIIEMKNWITEISQRQAMLILLLTNKKDTPNLVRFRPILLQGIAVNRITRASELDMEIEVIEREHFNKFSQYDGISYINESIENHDNLLEELYWIAKTTASDYQKPFNEASEKLLKSLLEKRKKLNPSYLRVMARYVGLGLLKTPKN
ncbi:uncharacterized protein LOC114363824 [Ostrinia furnacalis]|uniref:uncharacterized protein LOC114363824 n=1 Tax=Ostrinia furnacalis TaxID=93504 RepID=UPI00103D4B2F|nr:uncharacterized protein LOC114363824 [Ostrinia furnacalis]